MELYALLWKELMFFKSRFFKITSSQIVTPILYMITFGFGLGSYMDGELNYINFIMPGIVAMTSMRASYTAVTNRIIVARLHENSFETYKVAPIKMKNIALGYILSGTIRGIYASLLMLVIMVLIGCKVESILPFILVLIINSSLFASIGFVISMSIKTHYDLNRFTSYFITPMTFLCGAFFETEGFNVIFRNIIDFMPLTHTIRLLRISTLGREFNMFSLFFLLVYLSVLGFLSVRACYEEGI